MQAHRVLAPPASAGKPGRRALAEAQALPALVADPVLEEVQARQGGDPQEPSRGAAADPAYRRGAAADPACRPPVAAAQQQLHSTTRQHQAAAAAPACLGAGRGRRRGAVAVRA